MHFESPLCPAAVPTPQIALTDLLSDSTNYAFAMRLYCGSRQPMAPGFW